MTAMAAEMLHPYLSVTVESISVPGAMEWEVEGPRGHRLSGKCQSFYSDQSQLLIWHFWYQNVKFYLKNFLLGITKRFNVFYIWTGLTDHCNISLRQRNRQPDANKKKHIHSMLH